MKTENSKGITQERIRKTLTYRYVIFGIAAASYFFVLFHRMSTAVMAPDLAADFAVDPAAVGLFGSMYFYAYALAQIPSGILADRWGVRNTTSLFIFVAGCSTLLFGSAGTFDIALAARFLVGLGVGFMYVPALRILADWFRRNEYATYSGILVAIGNIGGLAATAPLALLIALSDWRSVITVIGIITIAIAVLLYLFVRNKPQDIGGASMAEIQQLPVMSAPAISTREAFGVLFRKYNFWTLVVLFSIWLGTLLAFQGLWAGPYLMNVFCLSPTQVGNIIMFIGIGGIVGCSVSGVITDKLIRSPKKVVMLGGIGYILVWVQLVFFTDTMSLYFVRILMFCLGFFGYTHIIVWANLRENVDTAMLGTASGLLNFFGFLGAALYQQILGIIIAQAPVSNNIIATSGFKNAFLVCLISMLFAFAFYSTQKST